MLKKYLAISLAVLVSFSIVFSALPAVALAAAGDPGTDGFWNWTELSDGTLEITGCTTPTGSLTLPDTLAGKTVTRIADNAFLFQNGITGISLPSTLTGIGENAFGGCTALQSIAIPSGVTIIPLNAFAACSSLETAILPNGLQSIGDGAFNGCEKLTSIAIPDTVTSIGGTAFASCSDLESATLPNNPAFTTLSQGLFEACTKLDGVVIPASVTSIETYAFTSCGITAITIPADVASIDMWAFRDCRHLMSIQVDPANTHFESAAGVLYNTGRTSLVAYPGGVGGAFAVPDSVIDIAAGAFNDCQNLTSIALTDHVQTIGNSAFQFTGITAITIPKSVTAVGHYAFNGCTHLKKAVFLSKNCTTGMMLYSGTDIASDGIYGFAGSTAQTSAVNSPFTPLPFHTLYTVTFQSSGGSAVDETYVETGHTFAAPTAPTKSGFTFSGWYADSGLTDAWDFSTDTVTGDTTLYAAWTAPTPTPSATPSSTASATPTVTPSPTATLSASPSAAPTATATPAPTLQITPSSGEDRIYTGGRITITPSVEGGTWSYDSSFLSRDGNTFTGLKVGTVRVTYTVGSQSTYIDIVITQAEMPQTGQDFSPALWALVLAVLAGGAALALWLKARRKKRA